MRFNLIFFEIQNDLTIRQWFVVVFVVAIDFLDQTLLVTEVVLIDAAYYFVCVNILVGVIAAPIVSIIFVVVVVVVIIQGCRHYCRRCCCFRLNANSKSKQEFSSLVFKFYL